MERCEESGSPAGAGRQPAGPAGAEGTLAAGRFREMMSRFPTGVSVVTALDPHGRPRGATCSALASVTLTPPTLLVCLRAGGSTLDAVRATGRCAVNLLRADAREAAEVFAAPFEDRFTKVAWRSLPSSGLPHLHRDAFACAECRVGRLLPAGDHVVVLGAVTGIQLSGGLPLMYGMREFLGWAPDGRRTPPRLTAEG